MNHVLQLSVPVDLLFQLIEVCEFAIENTESLLIEHDLARGRTTRKNRYVAALYENEMAKAKSCLEQLQKIIGST